MARTIEIGDIFEIRTPNGKAYLHYVVKDETIGEMIRILPGLFLDEAPVNLKILAEMKEKFFVFFPVKTAFNRKIIKRVGNVTPDFTKPHQMRSKHTVRGKFLGWHLVNLATWKRQLVSELTFEQKQFSPWGVWNDTLLIEKISSGWTPEQWI